MKGKQDSYHCQLESFHKQSKICLLHLYIHSSPKIYKSLPAQRAGSSFLHPFYILEIYIYRGISCGIQNVQTSHNSKIRDKLQKGMI
jgi:hypothetical protein